MLTLHLDTQSHQPLYEQIYRLIRAEIESGRLVAGARMPSKRALSAHLKVSIVTIEGAYGQLLAEGYLRAESRRGYYVRQAERAPLFPAVSAPSRSDPLPGAQTDLIYRFSTGAVDTEGFPFSTWARLMREVLNEKRSALLESSHPQGAPELRNAVAGYLRQFRGIEAGPEQIVVGAGAEYLTGLLFQLLGRSGGYAVEDPGYSKFHKILTHQGALICPIPLDSQGLRVDALRYSGARVVHVTPAHQFPLGTVMPVGRRKELLDWAEEGPERYVIEDDYNSEFRYTGRPIPALQSLDTGGRVIYLGTFAQSLAPSLRLSFLVLPPRLLKRYQQEFLFYSSTVPAFEQHTLAQFLEQGYFERHIARMRNTYRIRRDALLAAAKAEGITSMGTFSGTEAGLHLLFTLDKAQNERELALGAEAAGVGVTPLSSYCLTPSRYNPSFVLGYGRMHPEDMAPAFRLLCGAWWEMLPHTF